MFQLFFYTLIMGKSIAIIISCVFCFSIGPSYSQPLFGVNLASAEFNEKAIPGVLGKDYIYPGEQSLNYFNGKGFKLVRLPFLWERIQPVLNEKLDAAELAALDEFVANSKSKGMLVILDVHNYGRRDVDGKKMRIGSKEVPRQAFTDLWKRLSEHFKNESAIYGYGLMNEPHDMKEYSWVQSAQEAINGIRTVDKKHSILVAGNDWSSADRWPQSSDSLKYLKDPNNNLVFEAHVYFDRDASGSYRLSYKLDGVTPNTGVERVSHFVEWLKQNNKKGFIGEFGIPGNDEQWNVVMDNFLAFIKSNGVGGTYWAGGPWWGDYQMNIESYDEQDRPQMKALKKYLSK